MGYDSSCIRAIKEFDAAHGDFIVRQGWVLYADGASRELGGDGWGVMKPPPEDLWVCAKRKLWFAELKLAAATEEFEVYKNNLKNQAERAIKTGTVNTPNPPPGKEAIDLLNRLRKNVYKRRIRLEAAREEVIETKPANLLDREKRCEKNREENEIFLEEIKKIEI